MDRLRIAAGDSVCTLSPTTGGSLTSWHIGEQAMLRTAPPSGDPLDMASFPLVPYSNRIGDATFAWAGERIGLTRNFLPEPHAIHGVGWLRPWSIVSHSDDIVVLALRHEADHHWPWPFDARQHINIGPDRLLIDLSVTNRAPHAVPLAFGLHPYFDQAGASLRFNADSVWMAGDDNLPTVSKPVAGMFDFRTLAAVEGRSIDHCYSGVGGTAYIEWADRPRALAITSTLPAAVVYVPLGGDAFCYEPVPHINNALNLDGGEPAMPIIASGASYETSILLRAVPR